ncbi:hypothetical protein ACF0H5_004598 [Mactra antiquata]
MDDDLSFYEKIVDGWERTETENGVPYYINHVTECTSWDHPYWLKILEGLKDQSCVKYAAYRSALKIRYLQKQLHMHQVELNTIQKAFEGQGQYGGSGEVTDCYELLTLLIGIYQNSPNSHSTYQEAEMLADLTLNLLLNIFDGDKRGVLSVPEVKVVLVVFSSASLMDKYRFFYQELHDPSTYISAHALKLFLQAVMKIPEFLNESLAFGRTSEPAVASCQQMGKSYGGITADVFYAWLQKGPQTLVWIPTLHRLISCENVNHDVKCNICKTYPITGLRYKCLKCFSYNLCQECFFTGKTSKRHSVKHPTHEYCNNSTTKDDAAAFMKTLKNKLSRHHRQNSRLKYLPIEADNQYTNHAWSGGRDEDRDIHDDICDTARRIAECELKQDKATETLDISPVSIDNTHLVSPVFSLKSLSPKDDGLQRERDELNSIIQQLELENRMLHQQLDDLQKQAEDNESLMTSDVHNTRQVSTPLMCKLLKETRNLPIREPLPSEATPVFLSVPIIQVNNYQSDNSIYSVSPRSSLLHGPPSSEPDISADCSSLPYLATTTTLFNHQESSTPKHTPPRDSMSCNSLDELDYSPANFSLPSPTKSFDGYNSEEAELRAIVNEADKMFPLDLSYSRPKSENISSDDEILMAANRIQATMSEFVKKAVNTHPPPFSVN